eukprot:3752923-Heterocapsa_arctica.AAC.1
MERRSENGSGNKANIDDKAKHEAKAKAKAKATNNINVLVVEPEEVEISDRLIISEVAVGSLELLEGRHIRNRAREKA